MNIHTDRHTIEHKSSKNMSLTFRGTHCSNGRVREDNSGDVGVVKLRVWLVIKEPVSQLPTCCNSNCREEQCDISPLWNLTDLIMHWKPV